ncbi:hypothetical protein N8261_03405 [Flavobacteriaceae bacterium]|nr:hypothetical protein [Flavobacteriaceae bacterium]
MASANPSASIVFFLILTLAYSIFKYYTKSPSMIKIWTGIYFLVLIVVQFFINLSLTNEICGFTQYSIAFRTTIIPWLFIFGTLNVVLMAFPAWLSPFSNTVGYFFTYITGINSFFKSILKDRKTLNLGPKQADMMTAINNVYEDKSLIINSMTLSNLPQWWENMKSGGLLKSGVGPSHYDELMSYIKMKTEVAEFIWYALTGTLVTSVSYNSIINSGCTQSVEEMEKRHNEYLDKEKQISENNKTKTDTQIVYKTYE